jgi:hypothetical protein
LRNFWQGSGGFIDLHGVRLLAREQVCGARIQNGFSSERVGLSVPFTKQESHTLMPSFSVKSTLRFRSISAPHLTHRSSFGERTGGTAKLRELKIFSFRIYIKGGNRIHSIEPTALYSRPAQGAHAAPIEHSLHNPLHNSGPT